MTPPKQKQTPDIRKLIKTQLDRQRADFPSIDRSEFDQLSQNVEKLAEDFGQLAHGGDSIRDYIDSVTNDIDASRSARKWIALLAGAMILTGLIALMTIVFCPKGQTAFKAITDTHVQIAIIITLFGLSFGLMALLIKGAFQREKSVELPDILPDHIKMLMDSLRTK